MLGKKINTRNSIAFSIGVASTLTALLAHGLLPLILNFYIYSIAVIYLYAKGTLSDPRLLVVGFFTFYSTFFAINIYITGSSVLEINYDLINLSLKYQTFALLIFITTINSVVKIKKLPDISTFKSQKKEYPNFMTSERLIFASFLALVFITLYLVLTSGATSKLESNASTPLKTIGDLSFYVLTALTIIRKLRSEKIANLDFVTFLFIIIALVYMLTTGERDIFFRVILIVLIIYYDKNKNAGFLKIVVLMAAVAILVPISQAFKAVLISGSISMNEFILASVFSNEFVSAGRNFYSLLLYGVEHDARFLYGDVVRAIMPSALIDGSNIQSTTAWFGSTYRVEHGFSGRSGWGFTFVGQGYLIGDIVGIVAVISIYAFILGSIYNASRASVYWYVFYLFTLTTSIYVLRADMANFLSQTFKVGGVVIVFLYFSHLIFVRLRLYEENLRKQTNTDA